MRRGPVVFQLVTGLLWLGVAAILAWVAVGSTLGHPAANLAQVIFLLVGVAMVAVGTAWTVAAARQLRHPRPALRLDANGILDNQQRRGAVFIAWTGIHHFEKGRQGSVEVVYACPPRAEPDLAVFPAVDRRPLVLCVGLGMDVVALQALLERHLALHRKRVAPTAWP
jgi:hypothetical protein